MSQSEQKVVQYLDEAHASEVGLVSVLQSQIAITPEGSYREGLETHLEETRAHAHRLRERLGELEHGGNPFQAFVGFSEAVVGQMVALSKAPFDLWRGISGAEKVLKDAKDACASEALEIATYTALERLATQVGDTQTARLAASIRGDEERMLERILREMPKLSDAVVQAEIEPGGSDEITPSRAANGAREHARQANRTARADRPSRADKDPRADKASRADKPSRADTPGRADKTSQADKPSRADQTPRAEETPTKARARSRTTTRQGRPTLREGQAERRGQLHREQPWPGYDELTVAEIEAVLNEGDLERAQAVADYERAHKNRPEVIRSAMIPARFLVSTGSR